MRTNNIKTDVYAIGPLTTKWK